MPGPSFLEILKDFHKKEDERVKQIRLQYKPSQMLSKHKIQHHRPFKIN
jgi:hypothetical protein